MFEFLNTFSKRQLGLGFLIAVSFTGLMYQSGLLVLWATDEQYGHGLLVLFLLAFLLFERRKSLNISNPVFVWLAVPISLMGFAFFMIGDVSGISVISKYGVWFFAISVVFAMGGITLFYRLLVPTFILFILIPLPDPIGPSLTAQLQLISSKLGVWVIRSFGGIVYLEGNVIDMGGQVKLLVAEACAGLRYLFPLMSVGAIAVYVMRAPLWMRWVIFLSTIPITIFLNSFRIGVTGLLVEKWGNEHTEGFLHFFEGWIVFIFALIALIVVTWVLIMLTPSTKSIASVFVMGNISNENAPLDKVTKSQQGVFTLRFVVLSIAITFVSSYGLSNRDKPEIKRSSLTSFPLKISDWVGHELPLQDDVVAVAGASDYFHANFLRNNKPVNVYLTYYADQKGGQVPHSPEVCLPGDGWDIVSNTPIFINTGDSGFEANRLLIKKGRKTIIAYYWVKQGGNNYRDKFIARLDLVRIAIEKNRTDGGLVRFVTELIGDETEAEADKRLMSLVEGVTDKLNEYIPN